VADELKETGQDYSPHACTSALCHYTHCCMVMGWALGLLNASTFYGLAVGQSGEPQIKSDGTLERIKTRNSSAQRW